MRRRKRRAPLVAALPCCVLMSPQFRARGWIFDAMLDVDLACRPNIPQS